MKNGNTQNNWDVIAIDHNVAGCAVYHKVKIIDNRFENIPTTETLK